jgi:hypothetical protein
VGLAIAVGASLGLVAGAQTQEDVPAPTGPTATGPTGSTGSFAIECPDGLASASTVFDHILPAQGSVQSPTEALDGLMSWYELIPGADSSDDFDLQEADGAVVATLKVEGKSPVIVQFAELVPEFWVVGQVLTCENDQATEVSDGD